MIDADRHRRFLQSTTDFAVVHVSLDGIIEAWWGAAERVLGYTAEEAIGSSLSRFFTEEDLAMGLDAHEIEVALAQGRSEDDRWHVRKDGSRFWASGVLSAVKDESGVTVGLCKVLRDNTDNRMRIADLESQVEGHRQAVRHGGERLATLAHELRNPLMPIVSALALLERADAARFSEKALRILQAQVGLLRRLVEDMNSDSAGDPSPIELVRERTRLNAVLRVLVNGLTEAANAKGLRLSLMLPRASIWVFADPARLHQMLSNLLNNAIKYTPSGGHVSVRATVEADMGIVRIEDDGAGISAEILPRIFELFTREARLADTAGRGVGLAVVKELATAHGGSIEARSAGPGKGASFGLRIPLDVGPGSAPV